MKLLFAGAQLKVASVIFLALVFIQQRIYSPPECGSFQTGNMWRKHLFIFSYSRDSAIFLVFTEKYFGDLTTKKGRIWDYLP